MPFAEYVEEQLAAGAVEGHKAQLVQHDEVDALEPALEASELPCVAGLDEHPDQVRRTHEGDVQALLGRLDAERDGQMRFPRSHWARQDEVASLANPLAAGELGHHCRVHAVGRSELEAVEHVHLGEASRANPVTDHGIVS